ncbi:hypothetical protein Nepgr_032734 [Nepenthes gracilis]|uniref:Uncharacterized protein n=1 Tax=Nepenthes gracilis TaxID=150966 RepID=A0AAD3TKS5_NEPGR|nr:hypothetical protein Nepgr_032734 [Nepenthes gracilis]
MPVPSQVSANALYRHPDGCVHWQADRWLQEFHRLINAGEVCVVDEWIRCYGIQDVQVPNVEHSNIDDQMDEDNGDFC